LVDPAGLPERWSAQARMTIFDYQIPGHLATDSRSRIEVIYPTGGLAFTATPADIRLLCRHHMVNGEVNRRGYLKYVRLLVSVRAALRVQHAAETPQPTHMITRKHQGHGAKRWAQRLDRAQTGKLGSQESLFVTR
jgi:hypothetical protein